MQPSVSSQLLLSQAEYAAHEAELARLRVARDQLVPAQLREARTYVAADAVEEIAHIQEEQAVIDSRIARIEDLLRDATVVDGDNAEDVVTLGSLVEVEYGPSRKPMTLRVTGATVSSEPGSVSSRSPVGAALMGRRPGEIAVAELPDGVRVEVAIVAVR